MELKKCCICKVLFEGYGNNPDGAMWKDKEGKLIFGTFKNNEVCCNDCNSNYVIPGRLFKLKLSEVNLYE